MTLGITSDRKCIICKKSQDKMNDFGIQISISTLDFGKGYRVSAILLLFNMFLETRKIVQWVRH